MFYDSKGLERRFDRRLEISLPILLSGLIVNSKNISSAGVYFEAVIDNSKRYYAGKSVDFEIVAKTTTHLLPSRKIRLGGNGTIMRKTLIKSNQHNKVWGIALRFNEKLEIIYEDTDFSDWQLEVF
ncbi:MAG: hypothetical protein MRK02_08830 [Candidatus Scalindua sp.]|nr:hypothetical protein [Candidatus Scalindua sp.]